MGIPMGKNKLLIVPLFIGLTLLICSWLASYPISVGSDDFVFDNVSILYWFSLALLFPSMYMIAATCKNNLLKWIMIVGIVLLLYSLFFFYNRLATSDSLFFRGLNEYFLETNNLDSSIPGKGYFQWPAFFLFTKIAVSITGLELANFEFLMYAIIGILLTTALFIFATKQYRKSGFLAVIVFFIGMYYYLNYQFAPFTFSLVFLMLALVLEGENFTSGRLFVLLILFFGMTLSHSYVAIFYVIFLAIKTIIKRNSHNRNLFLLSLAIYILYQLTLTNNALDTYIRQVTKLDTNVSGMAGLSVTPVIIPIDAVAQKVVSAVLIITLAIAGIGFLVLLVKRKTTYFNKAIFLTGLGYFVFGLVFWVLGPRAIPIAFISVCLGAAYLFETKLKKFLMGIFLILLILLVFMPLHGAFLKGIDFSQTQDAIDSENFMLEKYNWAKGGRVLMHGPVTEYFYSRLGFEEISGTSIERDDAIRFARLNEYSEILYTAGLEQRLFSARDSQNYTVDNIVIDANYNVIYNNGFSFIFVRNLP
jgi:hypothetical protein